MKSQNCSRRSYLLLFLMVCFAAMIGVSACMLLSVDAEYREGEEVYDALIQYAHVPYTEEGTLTSAEAKPLEVPAVDFSSLRAVNPDVVAWLYCENTPINYPVVQGEDNAYYLNHLFDGTRNSAGCLFLDYRNTWNFTDQNSIIYGHNMKNKTMFSILMEYKEQAFYESHPVMFLIAQEGCYTIELFAGFVATTEDNAWQRSFSSQAEQEDWIQAAKEKSTFQSDVNVSSSDKLVTLSTCSYEFNNARYVVVGKIHSL